MLKIDFGGAKHRNDVGGKWKIMDAGPGEYFYDLNSGGKFPLKDNSVDHYYSSHTLEHAPYDNVRIILSEIRRTLKPGGIFRIVVPDFEKVIRWYVDDDERIFKGPSYPKFYPRTKLGALYGWARTPSKKSKVRQGVFSNGHNCAYDWETLTVMLKEAGFLTIHRKKFNQLSKPFIGKEDPNSYYKRYKGFSIYAEAS